MRMRRVQCVLLILVLILGLLPLGLRLGTGLNSRDPQRDLDRAIDRVEGALGAVEEIQTAENLEEAWDLAADAEQELWDARSILEDVEIPNWLWFLEQGALYWHGRILDKETEQAIEANVFVNGHLIAQAPEVQFLMWKTEENPIYVRVEAPGYNPWELRFRFHLQGLRRMEGPIRLVRQE